MSPSDPDQSALRATYIDIERGGTGLRTLRALRTGEVLSPFTARRTLSEPGRHTVQVGIDAHIELDPQDLAFIDHSCDPNAAFDVDRMVVVALRDVAPGDPLTFFYPSTEWRMATPFSCHCGSARCVGEVRGAAFLDRATLLTYSLFGVVRVALLESGDRASENAQAM